MAQENTPDDLELRKEIGRQLIAEAAYARRQRKEEEERS